jgi:hypothetical protein
MGRTSAKMAKRLPKVSVICGLRKDFVSLAFKTSSNYIQLKGLKKVLLKNL